MVSVTTLQEDLPSRCGQICDILKEDLLSSRPSLFPFFSRPSFLLVSSRPSPHLARPLKSITSPLLLAALLRCHVTRLPCFLHLTPSIHLSIHPSSSPRTPPYHPFLLSPSPLLPLPLPRGLYGLICVPIPLYVSFPAYPSAQLSTYP